VAVPELAGSALLEAAAFGTPSVIFATPGLQEQVVADQTGVIVDPARPERIASEIASVLSDASRWGTLSRNAASFVRSERTAPVVAQRMEDYLDRIRKGAV